MRVVKGLVILVVILISIATIVYARSVGHLYYYLSGWRFAALLFFTVFLIIAFVPSRRLDELFRFLRRATKATFEKGKITVEAPGTVEQPEEEETPEEIVDKELAEAEKSLPEGIEEKDDFQLAMEAATDNDEGKFTTLMERVIQRADGISQVLFTALKLYVLGTFFGHAVIPRLKMLTNDYPTSTSPYRYLGIVYERMKAYDDAIDAYDRGAKLSKNDHEKIYFELKVCTLLRMKGDYSQAEKILRLLSDRATGNQKASVFKELGELALNQGSAESAEALFERALRTNPENHSLREKLAGMYLNGQHFVRGLYHYQILRQVSGFREAVANNLAICYEMLGMRAKAVDLYEQAAAAGVTIGFDNLARLLINSGFLKEARQRIEQGLKQAESLEKVDERLGNTLSRIKEEQDKETRKEAEIVESFREMYKVGSSERIMSRPPEALKKEPKEQKGS